MDRIVFRLRQLPLHFDRLDTVRLLSRVLGVEASTIRIFSLARSVDPWIPSKVATLMFVDIAGVRNSLENDQPPYITKRDDEWCIEAENIRGGLVLDAHFRGLTPLYDPALHNADCIAISGLASHPFGSWQPKGGSKSFMWIRDALPQSLPNIRPILYGYDTTLVESLSFQSISDLALGLINQLRANGWTSAASKPIAFLAHSLGGIVLKQAFVSLANKAELDDPIRQAIRGAVFFGVPNFGMVQTHLLAVVEGQANMKLVEDLSLESAYLRQLDQQFSGISYLQGVLLHWCYETKKSPTVMLDSNGRWSRIGPEEVLVTPDSATRGLHGENPHSHLIYPINEDHSNMVKFSENDPNYTVITQRLAQILAPREYPPTKADGGEGSILKSNVAARLKNPEMASRLGPSHKMILSSLQVPGGDSRLEEVEDKFGDTFDWIYDQPDSGFSEWLQSGTGLFWINGKPGSGKSTLMKFIFKDQRTSDLLSDWKGESSYMSVAFFFHYRGTSLQKSFEGLLRNLLTQIISKNPALSGFLRPLFDKEILEPNDWTLPILQKGFHTILKQEEVPLHLCLFLDALDEYDGRLEFICQFLRDLGRIPAKESKRIKVCFSSRPWDIFTHSFKDFPGFQMHDYTQEDIREYCLGSIMDESVSSVKLEELIPDIVENARGVFLWVKFVVRDLAQATRTTTSGKAELKKLLESYPVELNSYYADIIERIPHPHRWKAYAMLETVVRAKEILEPRAFVFAVECSKSRTFQEAHNTLSKLRERGISDYSALVKQESRKYCGGLVEVVDGTSRQYVQALHQTVEDFVTNPKFKQLVLGQRARITVENGDNFLAKYSFLDVAEGPPTSTENRRIRTGYARAAEQATGRSMKEFINSVPRNVFLNMIPSDGFEITTLEYAASTGLCLYFKESLAHSPNLLRGSDSPLLSCIITNEIPLRDEEMIRTARLLLDNGFTLDQDQAAFNLLIMRMLRTDDGSGPVRDDMDTILQNRFIGLVELLLDHGQNPDIKIRTVWNRWSVESTPLHVGSYALVKLFLERGAFVNSLNSMDSTPLDHICIRNNMQAPNWFRAYEYYRRLHLELYKVTCLIVAQGGILKNAPMQSWERLLGDFSAAGLPVEDLRASVSLPQEKAPGGTSRQPPEQDTELQVKHSGCGVGAEESRPERPQAEPEHEAKDTPGPPIQTESQTIPEQVPAAQAIGGQSADMGEPPEQLLGPASEQPLRQSSHQSNRELFKSKFKKMTSRLMR